MRPLARRGVLAILLALVLVPVFMPVVFSLSESWQGLVPQGFTFRWYEAVFTQEQTLNALLISMITATSAVALDLAITLPGAYVLNRLRGRMGTMVRQFAVVVPLLFPPVVLGNALVQAFAGPPLALTGSLFMVVVAHALIGFPFMFRYIVAALASIDEPTLSEAAQSLGASLGQRLRYVVFPNIRSGIETGVLIVFAISVGEFEVTSMVAGFNSQTLPLVLFQSMRNDMRVGSAISAFLVLISVASFAIVLTFGQRLVAKSAHP